MSMIHHFKQISVTPRFSKQEVMAKIPADLCLDLHNNISLEEATCSAGETGNETLSFQMVLTYNSQTLF